MNHIEKMAGEILHWPFFLFLLTIALIMGCDKELSEDAENTVYKGPLRTLENAEIFHSDSGRVKARISAKKILYLQNEDREAPEGFHTIFYDKEKNESATLRADYAYYKSEDEIWQASGNVIIVNKVNKEILKTEELFWDPRTGDVNTEKFVKIETEEEVITGTGLEAKQDFSSWAIKSPEATFVIEEDERRDDL